MTPAELDTLRWLYTAFVNPHTGYPDRNTLDVIDALLDRTEKDPALADLTRRVSMTIQRHGRHGISVGQIQEIAEAEVRADIERTLALDSNLGTWLLAKMRVGPPVETRELENEAVEWFIRQGESWKGIDEMGQEIELGLDGLRDQGLIRSDGSFWQAV